MSNNAVGFDKICRFCGYEKPDGKFIFSSEAVKIGLLSKIKQLFPEETELINAEVILPKFICNSCETTIDYFFEFHNSVKLVQENLKKKIQPSKLLQNELCPDTLYKPPHLCHEIQKLGIITINFDSTGIITCCDCNMKLNTDEVRCLNERLSYCICNDCGYKDETHLFLPKKNGNLTCPRCSFMNKKNISQQNTTEVVQSSKFKCDICGKSFSSKGHLNRHSLTHFGAKPYLCENCGTGFNQKSSLKTHTMIHKKMNPFTCKWCGQQFRHKQTLLNHVMSIHGYVNETGNLYECDECEKKFINKAKLRRHYRSHSGEKPFKCNICDKTFSQNVNLKTHYKKHEAENQFPNISMYASQSVLNETEQGNLIQELFTDCQQLSLGLESISTDDASFGSDIQKNYSTETDMNLKESSTSNEMFYDMSSSYGLMYSDDTDLYDTSDVTKSSMLPTFSSLNTVP